MTITQDRTTAPLLTNEGPRRRDPIKAVTFSRVLHVETRKQVDTTAGRWFLIGIAGVTALVFAIMLFTDDGQSTWMNYLGGTTMPLSVLLPIVGIMAATSEWSQRTAMTNLHARTPPRPHRRRQGHRAHGAVRRRRSVVAEDASLGGGGSRRVPPRDRVQRRGAGLLVPGPGRAVRVGVTGGLGAPVADRPQSSGAR